MDNIEVAAPEEPTEAETVSDEEESETSTEEGTEGEENQEESEETEEAKENRKLTAQERIRQVIEQRNADRAEFEAKLAALEQKVSSAPKIEPDYIEITPQVEQQVNATLAEFDRLRVEAELEGDYLKAVQYKQQFDTILEGLQENQKRLQAAKEREAQTAQEQEIVKARAYNAEILRQQLGVPEDAWKKAGEWFSQECVKTPSIGIQFQEIEQRQGTMAAINYAYSVVVEKMGKPAQQEIEKKEKKPVSLTSTARPASNDLRDDLPIDEWMRRRKKQLSRAG